MAGSRKPTGNASADRVYFEFVPRGAYVKVSAVHQGTGTEVSIVGDARVTQADLQRIALRKLEKALEDQPKKRR
ncbi:MAG: serine hydroxymethyltransferase [Pseudomonadota bacterium]